MPSLKLAVVAGALSHDPRVSPRSAREAGFAGLQFDAFSAALRLGALADSGRREFLHFLGNQSQQFVGPRAELGPKGFGIGADVDRLLSGLDELLEGAAAMSATVACLDVGPLPEPPPALAAPRPKVSPAQAGLILLPEMDVPAAPEPAPAAPPPDPALVSQVEAAFGELGARAERYSVVVAFRSEQAGFAAIEQVIRRTGCPWFGIDLDPAAILRDRWPHDEVFSRLGSSVRHVRGRDANAGAERRTKPAVVGRGDTDWRRLLSDLDAAGYAGWLTVDPTDLPDRALAAAAGLKHLAAVQQG